MSVSVLKESTVGDYEEESVFNVTNNTDYDLRKSVWSDRYGALQPSIQRLCGDHRGFPPHQFRLIRYGTNLVIQAGFFIFRVSHISMLPAINANLKTLHALNSERAPIVRPLDREAIILDDKAVLTRWFRKVPLQEDTNISYIKLGSALKALHSVNTDKVEAATKMASSTNKDNIAERIESRLSGLSVNMPVEIKSSVCKLSEGMSGLYESIDVDEGYVIHGDASVGNAVSNGKEDNCDSSTSSLLIDLDSICKGNREIDLGSVRMATIKYGKTENYRALLNSYDDNSINHDLIETYSLIKELSSISWIATLWDRNKKAQEELQHRIWCFENNECGTEKWKRF